MIGTKGDGRGNAVYEGDEERKDYNYETELPSKENTCSLCGHEGKNINEVGCPNCWERDRNWTR